MERRKKEVLSLKQRVDSLDREQLELYHTILQNERLAALDTLRQFAQEANADIQAAKEKLAEVERTDANKGYFGVAQLKEDVEAANKSVYRLRSEVTAASAELLEVIALEDNEPEPERSPVKSLRISNRGDIDITFEQPQPELHVDYNDDYAGSVSGYGAVPHTPPPQSRFHRSGAHQPFSRSVRSAPQLTSSFAPRPPPSPVVYHPYDRQSFNKSPATDRFMYTASPRLRSLLPPNRQSSAAFNPSGSVGYNVHEAVDVRAFVTLKSLLPPCHAHHISPSPYHPLQLMQSWRFHHAPRTASCCKDSLWGVCLDLGEPRPLQTPRAVRKAGVAGFSYLPRLNSPKRHSHHSRTTPHAHTPVVWRLFSCPLP